MHISKPGCRTLAAVLLLAAYASGAAAAPISITNAGFSNPTLAGNTYNPGIAGWTSAGDTGTTRLLSPTVVTPSGFPQTAYLNYGQISQTLSATLQQGEAYILSFYYVARSDDPHAAAVVQLLAGSSVLSTFAVGTGTANPVALGTSKLETFTYNSINPSLSGALQILVKATDGLTNGQVDVTGFALDASPISPVPEPASLALLGAGLLGVAMARRKFA